MKQKLISFLNSCDVDDVIISNSLKDFLSAEEIKKRAFFIEDPRSMMYIATGIAAETQNTVIAICRGNNESRSTYSGLTEAYYRKLPILFITIGKELDYSIELNDCCIGKYTSIESIDLALSKVKEYSMPIHLEIDLNKDMTKKITLNKNTTKVLNDAIDDECYVFMSQSISSDLINIRGKLVSNEGCNGSEGCLANVLGASLAKKRKKYIGILSEKEFIHDINTLGNINANDLLFYIVLSNNYNSFIKTYSNELGYNYQEIQEKELTLDFLSAMINSEKKNVLNLVQ